MACRTVRNATWLPSVAVQRETAPLNGSILTAGWQAARALGLMTWTGMTSTMAGEQISISGGIQPSECTKGTSSEVPQVTRLQQLHFAQRCLAGDDEPLCRLNRALVHPTCMTGRIARELRRDMCLNVSGAASAALMTSASVVGVQCEGRPAKSSRRTCTTEMSQGERHGITMQHSEGLHVRSVASGSPAKGIQICVGQCSDTA